MIKSIFYFTFFLGILMGVGLSTVAYMFIQSYDYVTFADYERAKLAKCRSLGADVLMVKILVDQPNRADYKCFKR